MDYYNKYVKYKTKYLNLKYDNSQYGGGSVPCDKGYKNALGTCWAVSLLTILCFGDFTKDELYAKMVSFNNETVEKIIENAEHFINMRILKIKSDKQFTDVFAPNDIFSDNKIGYVKTILHKFIERYYNKVMNKPFGKRPETISIKENQERCEKMIGENFKQLFYNRHGKPSDSLGGALDDSYLFCNLLSIFFLDYKVSFKKYYDHFNLINFNPQNDLGIGISIPRHECSLFICDGHPKFYNDNNHKIDDCNWIELLKKLSSTDYLYVETDHCLQFGTTRSNGPNILTLLNVDYLTVISKYNIKDTNLDIDIKKILQLKYVKEITDRQLQFKDGVKIKDRELQAIAGGLYDDAGFSDMAIVMYTSSAEQGDRGAQNLLGNRFYNGNGVIKNVTTAMKWYKLAAQQYYTNALYMLGEIYYNKKDYVNAFDNYQLAATQYNNDAIYQLGTMFLNGNGVDKDAKQAKKLFELAADEDNTKAQYMLGCMYYEGPGIDMKDRNLDKAIDFLELAAKKGHKSAQEKLKDLVDLRDHKLIEEKSKIKDIYMLGEYNYFGDTLITQNYERAKEYYNIAAQAGYANAQYKLGKMFYDGYGGDKDYKEAIKWFTLAADQDNIDALYMLGCMYFEGPGIPLEKRDYNIARKYLKSAAEKGHRDARLKLKELEEVVSYVTF